MQVTARAPHRPCLISFVPAVSSAFFPLTARQPWSVVAASRSRVALKLLKWKRVCHSHYVRLSLGAPPSPLLAFHLPSLSLPLSLEPRSIPIHVLLACLFPSISTSFTSTKNLYGIYIYIYLVFVSRIHIYRDGTLRGRIEKREEKVKTFGLNYRPLARKDRKGGERGRGSEDKYRALRVSFEPLLVNVVGSVLGDDITRVPLVTRAETNGRPDS